MFAIIFCRANPRKLFILFRLWPVIPLEHCQVPSSNLILSFGWLLWIFFEVESHDEINRLSDHFSYLSSPRKMKQRVEEELNMCLI